MPITTVIPPADVAERLELEQKQRERLYKPSARQPEIVEPPLTSYLKVDGVGDPNNSSSFEEAIGALYALSFTLKFGILKAEGFAYRVGPLEGLWWAESNLSFASGNRSDWHWTLMIAQPSVVTPAWVARATDEVRSKKDPPGLAHVRFETFVEGIAAQIMHVGSYSEEGPTIERLHAFIRQQGGDFEGRLQRHHEIYLGDPRRAKPEKLKTVIRQPFYTHQ